MSNTKDKVRYWLRLGEEIHWTKNPYTGLPNAIGRLPTVGGRIYVSLQTANDLIMEGEAVLEPQGEHYVLRAPDTWIGFALPKKQRTLL